MAVECSGYILEELRDAANYEQFKKDVAEAPPIVNQGIAWLSFEGHDFSLESDEECQQIRCEVFLQLKNRLQTNWHVLNYVMSTLKEVKERFARGILFAVMVPPTKMLTVSSASSCTLVNIQKATLCPL